MTKYFVDGAGRYLGAFDNAEPPAGSIEVPSAPSDARQPWTGSAWGSVPVTAEAVRALAKSARAEAVSSIVVTTQAGNTFDGDEASQGRMSRAIIGMDDADTMPWVLADNTVISVDKVELREALRLSGAAQSALWVIP